LRPQVSPDTFALRVAFIATVSGLVALYRRHRAAVRSSKEKSGDG
jgi:hypothetical protein